MFCSVGLLAILGLVGSEVEGLFVVAGLVGSELGGLASSCVPVSWTLWLSQASLYYRMMQCARVVCVCVHVSVSVYFISVCAYTV